MPHLTPTPGGDVDSPQVQPLEVLPSALVALAEVEARATGAGTLAFFLDYDGTLTPIVENPSDAKLTEETRSTVRDLAARYPTAIVSGRARDGAGARAAR